MIFFVWMLCTLVLKDKWKSKYDMYIFQHSSIWHSWKLLLRLWSILIKICRESLTHRSCKCISQFTVLALFILKGFGIKDMFSVWYLLSFYKIVVIDHFWVGFDSPSTRGHCSISGQTQFQVSGCSVYGLLRKCNHNHRTAPHHWCQFWRCLQRDCCFHRLCYGHIRRNSPTFWYTPLAAVVDSSGPEGGCCAFHQNLML